MGNKDFSNKARGGSPQIFPKEISFLLSAVPPARLCTSNQFQISWWSSIWNADEADVKSLSVHSMILLPSSRCHSEPLDPAWNRDRGLAPGWPFKCRYYRPNSIWFTSAPLNSFRMLIFDCSTLSFNVCSLDAFMEKKEVDEKNKCWYKLTAGWWLMYWTDVKMNCCRQFWAL